jgi:hypothetical protein
MNTGIRSLQLFQLHWGYVQKGIMWNINKCWKSNSRENISASEERGRWASPSADFIAWFPFLSKNGKHSVSRRILVGDWILISLWLAVSLMERDSEGGSWVCHLCEDKSERLQGTCWYPGYRAASGLALDMFTRVIFSCMQLDTHNLLVNSHSEAGKSLKESYIHCFLS